MSKHVISKLIVLAIVIAGSALLLQAQVASSATDPMNGLPLHPGMTPNNDPMKVSICKKAGKVNQYYFSYLSKDTAADVTAWYKAHLPGFHYFHALWIGHPQELFYSPDGTKGVDITGNSNSAKVYSISYLSIQPGLTEHEMQAFSPSNASCK
jgi:hypothetical protein